MKSIKIFSIFAMAGLLFASCENESHPVYDSKAAEAPEVMPFQGRALDLKGEDLEVIFKPADFHVQVPVNYSFTVTSKVLDGINQEIKSTIDPKGTIKFTQKDLNTALLNLGATPEEPFEAEYRVVAGLKDDKGAVIGSTVIESKGVLVSFTPYAADLLDVDVYKHVWIIGAGQSIGGWGFDTIEQYLYEYETPGIYTGLVDYQWDAAKGWKMTGVNTWSEDCNWGLDGSAEAPEAEASSIDIISDAGSSDIKIYSHRFYMWEFDRNALKLSKKYGFNNIGIAGVGGDWSASNPNTKMKYNATTHKFFLDINIPAGTEMKFTCDNGWDLNFGAGCEQGGPNIVPDNTGNVRVYLDLNKNEYEFNTSKYGTEEEGTVWEPGEPQEYPSNMYMIGDFCGWNWDNAFEMTKINGSTAKFWTMAYIEAGKGFKFCDTKAWSGDFCTLDTNIGFEVDGGNCVVSTTGVYAVAVDYENKTISVEPAQIKGIGDAFLGWNDPVVFTVNGSQAYAITAATSNLRMYCDVTYYATDWWRMEFNIYDGKIVFRGDGGDQPAVPVEFGQKVTLDLTNLTGTIQ